MLVRQGFVIIAAGILVWSSLAVRRASTACGDTPETAGRMFRRFALAAAAWVALTMGLAASGVLGRFDLKPPPLMFLLSAIVVLGVVLARSTAGDRLARGISMAELVGLQAFRLPLELVMHEAHVEGLMPAQMSYSGLNFDIVTGITALLLAVWLRVGHPPRAVVMGWNIVGLALLVNIVAIAVLSTPIFAAFGSTPDRVNTFVTRPPYVLLPAVMVPAAWAGHLVIFKALASTRAGLQR